MRITFLEKPSHVNGFYEFSTKAEADAFLKGYTKAVIADAKARLEGLIKVELKPVEAGDKERSSIKERKAIAAYDQAKANQEIRKTALESFKFVKTIEGVNRLNAGDISFQYYSEEDIKEVVLYPEETDSKQTKQTDNK